MRGHPVMRGHSDEGTPCDHGDTFSSMLKNL